MNVDPLSTAAGVPSGHAIIQVTPSGENSILIYGGANQTLDRMFVERVLDRVQHIDIVLLQNETSATSDALSIATQCGLPIAFNPAPMTQDIAKLPLDNLEILIVNEVEAGGLVGADDPDKLCHRLADRFPATLCVLTAGARGAWAARGSEQWNDPGHAVQAVDTTGAGDTFVGFFLAEWLHGQSVSDALTIGNRASAVSVTRSGAADSIPSREEVLLT